MAQGPSGECKSRYLPSRLRPAVENSSRLILDPLVYQDYPRQKDVPVNENETVQGILRKILSEEILVNPVCRRRYKIPETWKRRLDIIDIESFTNFDYKTAVKTLDELAQGDYTYKRLSRHITPVESIVKPVLVEPEPELVQEELVEEESIKEIFVEEIPLEEEIPIEEEIPVQEEPQVEQSLQKFEEQLEDAFQIQVQHFGRLIRVEEEIPIEEQIPVEEEPVQEKPQVEQSLQKFEEDAFQIQVQHFERLLSRPYRQRMQRQLYSAKVEMATNKEYAIDECQDNSHFHINIQCGDKSDAQEFLINKNANNQMRFKILMKPDGEGGPVLKTDEPGIDKASSSSKLDLQKEQETQSDALKLPRVESKSAKTQTRSKLDVRRRNRDQSQNTVKNLCVTFGTNCGIFRDRSHSPKDTKSVSHLHNKDNIKSSCSCQQQTRITCMDKLLNMVKRKSAQVPRSTQTPNSNSNSRQCNVKFTNTKRTEPKSEKAPPRRVTTAALALNTTLGGVDVLYKNPKDLLHTMDTVRCLKPFIRSEHMTAPNDQPFERPPVTATDLDRMFHKTEQYKKQRKLFEERVLRLYRDTTTTSSSDLCALSNQDSESIHPLKRPCGKRRHLVKNNNRECAADGLKSDLNEPRQINLVQNILKRSTMALKGLFLKDHETQKYS